jgi:hypothetical protein
LYKYVGSADGGPPVAQAVVAIRAWSAKIVREIDVFFARFLISPP